MAHMTAQGQNSQGEHIQGFPDFHSHDRMTSYSQFDAQKATKDFIPPDPLEMRPGMYIPPEETAVFTHMNPSLDDIMGWSQSDEEQQDTDEDEEDNEFDMEFDDPEGVPGMPPTQTSVNPTLCERHLSKPNFSTLESTAYTPKPIEPVAYPVLTRYEYEQQPGYKAPFNFINPSSLQLKSPMNNSVYSTADIASSSPDQDDDDALHESSAIDVDSNDGSEPMISEPLEPLDLSSDSKAFEDIGLSMDMDFIFDDHHAGAEAEAEATTTPFTEVPAAPVASRDSPQIDHQTRDSPKLEAVPEDESRPALSKQPATPVVSDDSERNTVELHTPPMSAKELPLSSPSSESPVAAKLDSPLYESSSATLSPPPEKPRKRTTRRAPRAGVSSHSSNAHVCNMSFADGRECHRSFTRPYDLARHQETIHAPVRRTYKCDACGEKSKTFSRLDALSRHVRLKHSA